MYIARLQLRACEVPASFLGLETRNICRGCDDFSQHIQANWTRADSFHALCNAWFTNRRKISRNKIWSVDSILRWPKDKYIYVTRGGRSQWPRCLRRGSAAVRLLGLRVRIPPGAWMSVSSECCLLSGRGLCDGLITRPEESYRMWCV
jgi:hypothetical protein